MVLDSGRAAHEQELGALAQSKDAIELHPGIVAIDTRALDNLRAALGMDEMERLAVVDILRAMVITIKVHPFPERSKVDLRISGNLARILAIAHRNE